VIRYILLGGFAICVFIAVVGNLLVHLVLIRRGIPVDFFRAGTPFYLYGICGAEPARVGRLLRGLALLTNLTFIAAFALGVILFVVELADV